jgi:signal peptidase I
MADLALAVVAVLLTLGACPLGMKASPKVSGFTNVVKKIAYPVAVVLAGLFIGFRYVGYYQVPQNGMYPALPAGSRLLTIRRPYKDSAQVARGDIVLFARTEHGVKYDFIWRVVGLPGDTIRTAGDAVLVNGAELKRQQIRSAAGLGIFQETNGEATYEVALPDRPTASVPPDVALTVHKDQFFVLGDNRHQARDSRSMGCIPFAAIVGKTW